MALSEYKNVGFIGLGNMGKPMAANLAKKLPSSTTLNIFDLESKPLDEVKALSPDRVHKCSSPKDVAEKSDIILTMLPEGRHVRAVFFEEKDCLAAVDLNGKILVDCSTIDQATSQYILEQINQKFPSAFFFDAPVSGGTIGAEAATMAFFLGVDEKDPKTSLLKELCGLMGKNLISCGGPTLGLAAKLSNNYLAGVIIIASSEAMNMGMKAGLDPRVLYEVISAGTAQNSITSKTCPVPGILPNTPASNGYKPGFKVELMRKDMGLAMDLSKQCDCKNILGQAALQAYRDASDDPKCAGLDSKIIYRYLGGNENWQK